MKRLFWIVLSLVVILGLVAGCAGASAEEKIFTNSDEVIRVKAGEEFVISLEANPTTGYSWVAASPASWLEFLGKTYVAGEPAMLGSGGKEELRFKASAKGSTTITLGYGRSWEATAIEQKTFEVEVK